MTQKKNSLTATIVVGLLFGVPFAGFGLSALWKANEMYGTHSFEAGKFWGLLGCGLIFSFIGLGVIYGLIKGWYHDKRVNELIARHPDEPWRHRPDWASGRVACDSKSGVIGAWFFTLVVCGLSAPGTLAIPEEFEKGNHLILLVLLFTAVGLYLFYRSIVLTLRWYRFGNTILKLSKPTGVIGGTFEARLLGKADLPSGSTLDLTIRNKNRKVIGSGKHRSVKITVWYEDTHSQPVTHGNLRTGIPITFDIPNDARATDLSDSDNEILWEVEVKAEIPGSDFEASFMVPVFTMSQ